MGMRSKIGTLGIALLLLTTTGCSGEANSADQTNHSAGPTPTGEPIVIGMTALDEGSSAQPAYADGLQAWADLVNREGGIDGRPVKLDRCSAESTTEDFSKCARGFVDDQEVIAVSSVGTQTGITQLPIYEPAGMGLILISPFTRAEMESPNAIALGGSIITGAASLQTYFMKEKGVQKISFIGLEHSSVHEAAAGYERIAGELGLTWAGANFIAFDAADMLPAVTTALQSKPDALQVQLLPHMVPGVLEALNTLGSDIPVLAGSSFVTDENLAHPDAPDRLFWESDVAPAPDSGPALADQKYLEERFGSGLTTSHRQGFVLGRGFERAIAGAGGANADRASMLEFIKTGTFSDLPFLPPSISRSEAPSESPALGNQQTYVVTADGSGGVKYVSDLVQPGAL